jgi:hypothetical protein
MKHESKQKPNSFLLDLINENIKNEKRLTNHYKSVATGLPVVQEDDNIRLISSNEQVDKNLENQLRLFVKTDDIQDQDKNALNVAITNIAGSLVDKVTNSKISSKNDVFTELDNLLENYQFTFNGEAVKKENLKRIKDAVHTIKDLNASSDKNILRFMATQINEANEAKKEIYIEDIKSISANAAWVKKHKGVTSEKALILGKEMNRSELLDLTNNQKFNVLYVG